MRKGRDGGKKREKRGKKQKKRKNGGKKENTDENSGHYVIASSRPPERRTLAPKTGGKNKTRMKIVATTSLPAVDRPTAAHSRQLTILR